jgi:hypothetical protein
LEQTKKRQALSSMGIITVEITLGSAPFTAKRRAPRRRKAKQKEQTSRHRVNQFGPSCSEKCGGRAESVLSEAGAIAIYSDPADFLAITTRW